MRKVKEAQKDSFKQEAIKANSKGKIYRNRIWSPIKNMNERIINGNYNIYQLMYQSTSELRTKIMNGHKEMFIQNKKEEEHKNKDTITIISSHNLNEKDINNQFSNIFNIKKKKSVSNINVLNQIRNNSKNHKSQYNQIISEIKTSLDNLHKENFKTPKEHYIQRPKKFSVRNTQFSTYKTANIDTYKKKSKVFESVNNSKLPKKKNSLITKNKAKNKSKEKLSLSVKSSNIKPLVHNKEITKINYAIFGYKSINKYICGANIINDNNNNINSLENASFETLKQKYNIHSMRQKEIRKNLKKFSFENEVK